MKRTTYCGKIRAKHKLTNKVKYFNSIDDITPEFVVVSICGIKNNTQKKTQKKKRSTKKIKDTVYYKDAYKTLIRYRLKNRLQEIYDNDVYQHHHIFPKSIFGQNDRVVLLTKFEHCLAHYYLFKMYKHAGKKDETRKMCAAYRSLRSDCGYPDDINGCIQFLHTKTGIEKDLQIQ